LEYGRFQRGQKVVRKPLDLVALLLLQEKRLNRTQLFNLVQEETPFEAPSTSWNILDRLERMGYVCRVSNKDPADRNIIFEVTESGYSHIEWWRELFK